MPSKPGTLAAESFDCSAESWAARFRLLVADTERLLAVIENQRDEDRAWQDERALFRAMIDQVPDYLFVKDRESRLLWPTRRWRPIWRLNLMR